jgi:hypothetical protein
VLFTQGALGGFQLTVDIADRQEHGGFGNIPSAIEFSVSVFFTIT